jgi:hypothetical protein
MVFYRPEYDVKLLESAQCYEIMDNTIICYMRVYAGTNHSIPPKSCTTKGLKRQVQNI